MTTYEYETDVAWSQAAAVGQALYVEDNLGHRTYFRYDGRGNRTLVTDALGSTWETVYNLADQVVSTQQPATGQQGSGRVTVLYEYVFPGGPRTEVTVLDEAGAVVQHVNHQLGAEGELLAVCGAWGWAVAE
ncbi:MAG: RHS repeat protein [Fimbriimonadaceae bacterium]|nr:RHS repeat protein [Fimbriimonadaceae bacterium]